MRRSFGPLKRLAGDSFVYGLSGVLSRFLTIFLVPIYTRFFAPEDFGVIGLVTTTVNLIAMVSVLGLDNSAHRWYWDTEDREDRKKTMASWAWCQIVLSLIFTVLLFFVSGILGEVLIHRSDAKMYFRLSAMALPLGVLGGVTTNWLRMQRRAWATLYFAVATNLFNALMTIILVVIFRQGLKGVYVAQLATAALATGAAAVLLRDWMNPRKFDRVRLTEMLRFALPLVPGSVAFWVVHLSWSYFVQAFSSTADVGLYQVGSYVASVVGLLTGAFQQAWGPFAMSVHKDPEAKEIYADVFLVYCWTACLLGTGLYLFSREILMVFTTKAYLGASRVVGILAFNYAFIGLGYIAVIGSTIARMTKPYGKAVVIAAILTVILNLAFIPLLGKEGSAFASLAAQSFVPIYVFYHSQKLYPIPYRFGVAMKISVLSLAVILFGGVFIPETSFMVGLMIKSLLIAVFFPALFVLKILDAGEARRFFMSRLGKARV